MRSKAQYRELSLLAARILQQLEMRNLVFIQCDKFAIYYGVAFHAFKRFRDFDVAVADDLAVAAIESYDRKANATNAVCQNELIKAGKPYPRSCPTCGLTGPCVKGIE